MTLAESLGYGQGGWRQGAASARHGTVRWDILDPSLSPVGSFTPTVGAQIRVDQDGNVRRRLSNLTIPSADMDPARTRIRPVWVDGDTETNLGVYRIASAEIAGRHSQTYRGLAPVDVTAADESVRLLAHTSRSIGFKRGASLQAMAETLAGHLAIPEHRIDSTTEELGEPMSWALGETTWQEVCDKVAAACGTLPPWFDRDGTWRWTVAPVVETQPPDWRYSMSNGGVILGGLERSVTLLDEPNVWYAINPQAKGAPIVGRHALGEHWPNSVGNIGYEQPERVEAAGLRSQAAANNAARAAAVQHVSDVGSASLTVPFDPAHDLYETCEVDGYLYQITGWSHDVEATTMTLDLNRIYRASDATGAYLSGAL